MKEGGRKRHGGMLDKEGSRMEKLFLGVKARPFFSEGVLERLAIA